MRAIIALSIFAAVGQAQFFQTYQPTLTQEYPASEWPNVSFPESFRLDLGVYTVNNWGALVPYFNATAYQLVDSVNNRELTVAQVYIEEAGGMTELGLYYDCTTSEITYNIVQKAFCASEPIRDTVNLRELIRSIKDPKGGITTYLGKHQLPFDKETLHRFRLKIETKHSTKYEELFFSTKTLQLKYFNVLGDIFHYKTKGLVETTFTDKDFEQYDVCGSSTNTAFRAKTDLYYLVPFIF